jgi:hypothetical protein
MNLKITSGVAVMTLALSGVFVGTSCSPAAESTLSSASALRPGPSLEGRAVLPANTLAPGPVSGTFLSPGVVNGITIPFPSQPVEGFSAIVAGRAPGELLAMPDNGYGAKASSRDFIIRAYYIRPDFKTAASGSGSVVVGDFIQFSDPDSLAGFPIVNDGTPERLLTGGDIDPESLRRDRNGDLWVGDEFGPWLLHFDAQGKLLEAPFQLDGVRSPNNPFLAGQPATHPNSRGYEGIAISSDGTFLYAALEGAIIADADQSRRYIYEFSTRAKGYTGRNWQFKTENAKNMIADMWALDENRLVVIERDGGSGVTAVFRNVYLIDLRSVGDDGFLEKSLVVDLTKIADPDLVSLPALHDGDLGLGNPFWVMCESVEAIYAIDGERLLIGCDNNLPNTGRNPGRADDNELIVVRVPGLQSL